MKLVIFGLTVSSSWGNGHATLWRGWIRGLLRRGRRVVFFEKDAPHYAENRDLRSLEELGAGAGGFLWLYSAWNAETRAAAERELADADAGMVTSYCPDGPAAAGLLLGSRAARKVFYDLDTPVTLERLRAGLPDTVWFSEGGFRALAGAGWDELAFLLFPVERPELFDAVVADDADPGRAREIQVKQPGAASLWIWGAMRMPGRVLHALHRLRREREEQDEYLGALVNAYLAAGGSARAVRAGKSYVDVGALHGYREALRLLERKDEG